MSSGWPPGLPTPLRAAIVEFVGPTGCGKTTLVDIILGAPRADRGAVERAARAANLETFVGEELPDGYDTVVGERGIRLSGGRRRRVGIARALYHDPDILVMDEATSALDSVTEEAVMDAIHNLMHTKTIILIAHRITTVRECDMIYPLFGVCSRRLLKYARRHDGGVMI